jgi:hypothetical protein
MFRKKPIVKLVFVFANEYDNAYTASYSYDAGFSFRTTVVVPGIQKGNVMFCTKGNGILGGKEQKEAIDPYCVK